MILFGCEIFRCIRGIHFEAAKSEKRMFMRHLRTLSTLERNLICQTYCIITESTINKTSTKCFDFLQNRYSAFKSTHFALTSPGSINAAPFVVCVGRRLEAAIRRHHTYRKTTFDFHITIRVEKLTVIFILQYYTTFCSLLDHFQLFPSKIILLRRAPLLDASHNDKNEILQKNTALKDNGRQ